MSAKPQVWIATILKSWEYNGPMELETVLSSLDDRFSDPIRELDRWTQCPWDIKIQVLGGGGIYQARNKIASLFYAETTDDNDRLFFADYDLIRTAQDYVDVLAHDLSIVGGLYTTRADNGHWVMNRLNGAKPNDNGILPVMELGTGHKCWKRSVFKKVLQDNPWITCQSDGGGNRPFHSFFSMGPVWDKKQWPGIGRGLTEDYWFDWICRESGFVTCANTRVKLRHYDEGSRKIYPVIFPPDPGRLTPEAKEP